MRKDKKALIVHTDEGEKVPDICGSAIELINYNNSKTSLFSTAMIIIDPFKESAKHYHKIMEEIYFIIEGKGNITLDDKLYKVEPGHSIFIPAMVKHQIKNTSNKALKFLSIDAPSYDEKDVYLV